MDFRKTPPPHFQGLRDDLPIRRYRRILPHWRQEGATYFVTYHLKDALPVKAVQELQAKRELFDQQHPQAHCDVIARKRARLLMQLEKRYIDKGYGSCPLQAPELRSRLQRIMAEDEQAELGAFIIMPNHIHSLVRPLSDELYPLERILQAWKSRSAITINEYTGASGPVWFQESYDTIVRDSEHLWRCLQYIGRNGVTAGLEALVYDRWVCPDWVEAGWGFDSQG